MVLTETINYHANQIGAIRTNKDYLNEVYDVDIKITRRRFGEYQEVDIIGSNKNIRLVKQKLQEIVEIADYEYQQYKERKKGRQWAKRQQYNFHKENESKIIPQQKKKNSNLFSALVVDEDENFHPYNIDFPELKSVYTNTKPLVHTSTKPVVNTITKPLVHTPTKPVVNTSISWADMSDDEE